MEDLQRALDVAKIDLMRRPDSTFFTTVCFSLKHEWSEAIPTAATNGKWIRFNPRFFMKLTKEERVFLLLHETLHVALMHMDQLKERNHRLWNIAADHVINLMLIDRGYHMPKEGLADPQYAGLSTEEVYERLLQDPPENMPEDFTPDIQASDDEGDEGDEGLRRDIEDILIRAAVQAKMAGDSPGSIPGDIQIYLDKLLNPKLPWQRILQKFIQNFAKNDYSFRRPNRRHFPEHYLPSLYSENLVDLTIAVDTSGSVTDEEFRVFVNEVGGIFRMMKPEQITLIQFDADIKAVNTVHSIQELQRMTFTGRGGTLIEPVLQWAKEHKPQLLLVFSDGHFRFFNRHKPCETLWIIHNHEGFSAPFGKTIHYAI